MKENTDGIEQYRITTGPLRSSYKDGFNGFFEIPHPNLYGYYFSVQCSDGEGWEHVSVTVYPPRKRTKRGKPTPPRPEPRLPGWEEMCFIKDLFWDEEERVVQYHPPKSEYVNLHPAVLHMWRPIEEAVPFPPGKLVGPQGYRAKRSGGNLVFEKANENKAAEAAD